MTIGMEVLIATDKPENFALRIRTLSGCGSAVWKNIAPIEPILLVISVSLGVVPFLKRTGLSVVPVRLRRPITSNDACLVLYWTSTPPSIVRVAPAWTIIALVSLSVTGKGELMTEKVMKRIGLGHTRTVSDSPCRALQNVFPLHVGYLSSGWSKTFVVPRTLRSHGRFFRQYLVEL